MAVITLPGFDPQEGPGGQGTSYRAKLIFWLIALSMSSLVFLFSGQSPKAPLETGILRGSVSIGPLVPVSRPGIPDPTPSPAVYEARKVVVSGVDGSGPDRVVNLGSDGAYEAVLPVGAYTVDINRIGVDFSKGLPFRVEIGPDAIVVLDISIDTGIR